MTFGMILNEQYVKQGENKITLESVNKYQFVMNLVNNQLGDVILT